MLRLTNTTSSTNVIINGLLRDKSVVVLTPNENVVIERSKLSENNKFVLDIFKGSIKIENVTKEQLDKEVEDLRLKLEAATLESERLAAVEADKLVKEAAAAALAETKRLEDEAKKAAAASKKLVEEQKAADKEVVSEPK